MDSGEATTNMDYGWLGPDFWKGVKSSGPLFLGFIPFGIACGIMGTTAGLKGAETLVMSLLVFAGASQFVAIAMLAAGTAGAGLVVMTTMLVNLPHLLMGASLAKHLAPQPLPRRGVLSFLMTYEAYAVTIGHIQKAGYSAPYQFGVSISLYVAWAFSTLAGLLVGSHIPDPLAWGIDFAMPATFLVLLIPRIADRVTLIVSLVTGIIATVGALYLPGKWFMIGACLGAVLVGGLLEGSETDEN